MKIYLIKDKHDQKGHLTHIVQAVKGVHGVKSKIFITSEDTFHFHGDPFKCDLDELVKQHFSIEDIKESIE